MPSRKHCILSGCVGVMLALASNVLLPPLWAVLVAMACVGTAWVLLRPGDRGITDWPKDGDGLLGELNVEHRGSAGDGADA